MFIKKWLNLYLLKKKGEVGCCGRASLAHNTPLPALLRSYLKFLTLTALAFCACAPTPSKQSTAPAIATVTTIPTPPTTLQPSSTQVSPTSILTSTITPFVVTITPTSSATPQSTITFTPTSNATPTADTRLTAYYWREWAVIPTLSNTALSILELAQQNPTLDAHNLSTVGDCQMVTTIFLGGYAREKYPIPSGLEDTVDWFRASITRESITAYNGLGINSVLNPMFGYAAGHKECDKNETPLTCELRVNHPIVVLIGMGTNWKPNAELSFEEHLRQVVDEILATGALPILATKADNVEGNWKLNEVIAEVAYDYDLPMINIWRAVQDLPNRGLQDAPDDIYLTPNGWLRRNEAWLKTLQAVYIVLREK